MGEEGEGQGSVVLVVEDPVAQTEAVGEERAPVVAAGAVVYLEGIDHGTAVAVVPEIEVELAGGEELLLARKEVVAVGSAGERIRMKDPRAGS
jgi:hypothetical protein